MRRLRRGFSLIELLIVVAVIVILLTVAIPNLLTARLTAAETMVIREVQTIGQAEMQYQSLFGKYAAALAELGPPATGMAGPQAAELIPGKLASGEKNGYLYTLTLTSAGFAVNANPREFGNTGRRTFYMDQSGIVHQNLGREPATANSPEL